MRSCSLLFSLAFSLCALTPQANAGTWIRDEIRVNMRAGPGLEFKIIELLTSVGIRWTNLKQSLT